MTEHNELRRLEPVAKVTHERGEVAINVVPGQIVWEGEALYSERDVRSLLDRIDALSTPSPATAGVTDEMVEAGLANYAEGGCSGLDEQERREVVRNILEAAILSAITPRTKDDEPDTTQVAVDICDAVLAWIVKHDLGDRDDEFTPGDVTSILDDLWGVDADQPGDPKAAEAVLRSLIGQSGTKDDRERIAVLEAALRDARSCLDGEPTYHHEGMGCGLEDRNIRDRYEAMEHGWECAMERVYGEHINGANEVIDAALTPNTGKEEGNV